ncbi:MAG: redoxin domain-containing protein [Candidatus Aminicenantes bacterium]|nr:MAG: redoxin domain-containing protein [Candidatus Aminicenantes bacterium]
MKIKLSHLILISLICISGCVEKNVVGITGHWRASLETTGGEVPCDMIISEDEPGSFQVEFHNAEEIVKFSRVVREGSKIKMIYDRFECLIEAELSEDGRTMSGKWTKTTGEQNHAEFTAVRGKIKRFPESDYPALKKKVPYEDISGSWRFVFEDPEFEYDCIAYFKQTGHQLTGTIRSQFGDIRYLEGVYRNGLFCLSYFNGTWVFIFNGEMNKAGIIKGIWARGHQPPTKWTIEKAESNFCDPWKLTKLTSKDEKFRFCYPKTENPEVNISNDSPELKGKPYLIVLSIFSCPNSQDHVSMLSQLYKEYCERGLEIIFVIMKMPDDIQLIQKRCDRLAEEHDFPAIYAYSLAMNKERISENLPDIEKFYSWPTTVFVGRDGRVNAIHSGMDGPGTGIYHHRLVIKYRVIIEQMINPHQ